MSTEIKQIMDKLDHLQTDIEYIKEYISKSDTILTSEDIVALSEAEVDLKVGKTKRLV